MCVVKEKVVLDLDRVVLSGEDQFKLYIFAESEISLQVPGLGRLIIKKHCLCWSRYRQHTGERFTTRTARQNRRRGGIYMRNTKPGILSQKLSYQVD